MNVFRPGQTPRHSEPACEPACVSVDHFDTSGPPLRTSTTGRGAITDSLVGSKPRIETTEPRGQRTMSLDGVLLHHMPGAKVHG